MKCLEKAWMELPLTYPATHDIDKRHGGPYDRGGADSYYRRGYKPHYFVGATNQSTRIEMAGMTPVELAEYAAGYRDNEEAGKFKDWG